ncbi:MAG: PadR family transcriptional regulator [bacterium]|nr:PadR family transcriptional regulator [bacterium]
MITKLEEQILLSVVKFRDDAYGINVYRHLEEITGEKVAIGVIYFTLDRLTKKGFLSSWKGEPTATRGGMRKRFYKITDKGKSELEKAKKVSDALWDGVSELVSTGSSE